MFRRYGKNHGNILRRITLPKENRRLHDEAKYTLGYGVTK